MLNDKAGEYGCGSIMDGLFGTLTENSKFWFMV